MNTFPLTVTSQTNSLIYFSWTEPADAQWYTFYVNGKRVSNGGPPKSATHFSLIQDAVYEVVVTTRSSDGVYDLYVGKYVNTPAPPPPPPPPPIDPPPVDPPVDPPPVTPPPVPSNPPVIMGAFNTTGKCAPLIVEAKNAGSTDTPGTVMFGTWSYVADPKDPKNFCGRIDLPAATNAKSRAEFKHATRPNTDNVLEVYSYSIFLPAGFDVGTVAPSGSPGDCITIAQLRWCGPAGGLNGSPIALELHPDHITLGLNAGSVVTSGGPCQFNSNWDSFKVKTAPNHIDGMLAVPVNRYQEDCWHDLIIPIFWSSDQTKGALEVYHRIRGQETNWTKTVDSKTVNGFGSTLSYMVGKPPAANCYDKQGLYRWTHSDVTTFAAFDNFGRFNTLQDAFAYFG